MSPRKQTIGHPYQSVLADLGAASEPVTFYDAYLLVRQMRGLHDLPDALLGQLLQLHDNRNATLGARRVLGEFFARHASRRAGQSALAARPIVLKDDGKTARAAQGAKLTLHLDERRPQGYRWEVLERPRGIPIARDPASADTHATAIFSVTLQRKGSAVLRLEERPPAGRIPSPSGGKHSEPAAAHRTFTLHVVVE